MSRHYGWTGRVRHGLWKCKRCEHWNYYRTHTLRIDSRCRGQGCEYRARVVLDREDRKGGRLRQVIVTEYPHYRPPETVKIEQRMRNTYARRHREIAEHLEAGFDRGTFTTATDLQKAVDVRDLARHGVLFRLRAREDLKRHPSLGQSRLEMQREDGTWVRVNPRENLDS
ncbi:MAG TPA: hypothetical protein EYO33_30310 [Phycisphaerales bacterium]|nr:hypothetical protein [Phycisphaerales bacterium]